MRRILLALAHGAACHAIFAVAVAAMISMMWFGMSRSFGAVPAPWLWGVNAFLALQFAAGHSFFLSGPGRRLLARLAPGADPDTSGRTLAVTTYATVASLQLLALFALWTPSSVVWFRAEGPLLWAFGAAYGASWLLLAKASFDAGAEVQSGLLGWWSLLRDRAPRFPPMPETGLFRVIRQPIYAAFALTLWTVPVWTPDQLLLATILTGYCLLGPLHKERRFDRMFGDRWRAYRARTPYWLPTPRGR